MASTIPVEAIALYDRARAQWNKLSEEEGNLPQLLRPIASDLLLAIKKSGNIYPEAHGFLSFIFVKLDDLSRAKEHWRIALQQDGYQPQAWFTRVMVAIATYAQSKGGQVDGAVWKVLLFGVNSNRETHARQELSSMIQAFKKLTRENKDPKKWCELADSLLGVGDMLPGLGIRGFANVYREIANAPWNSLQPGVYTQEIAELLQRAEGGALMHR